MLGGELLQLLRLALGDPPLALDVAAERRVEESQAAELEETAGSGSPSDRS